MDNNFSNYLIDVINKGSLSIMLSIGHRTKLFDILSIPISLYFLILFTYNII